MQAVSIIILAYWNSYSVMGVANCAELCGRVPETDHSDSTHHFLRDLG